MNSSTFHMILSLAKSFIHGQHSMLFCTVYILMSNINRSLQLWVQCSTNPPQLTKSEECDSYA